MSISLNTLEAYGMTIRSLLNEAEEIFPPLSVSPADSHDVIMYQAGQRSVIEWINQRLSDE